MALQFKQQIYQAFLSQSNDARKKPACKSNFSSRWGRSPAPQEARKAPGRACPRPTPVLAPPQRTQGSGLRELPGPPLHPRFRSDVSPYQMRPRSKRSAAIWLFWSTISAKRARCVLAKVRRARGRGAYDPLRQEGVSTRPVTRGPSRPARKHGYARCCRRIGVRLPYFGPLCAPVWAWKRRMPSESQQNTW